MKIGFIIPSTSNKRNWKCIEESYLYQNTLTSFFTTYDKEHSYVFYIGIDEGDAIYDNAESKEKLIKFCKTMPNINIEFIYMTGINKGHLTRMWNRLFKKAYNDGCDYFYQCGDDIEFETQKWINDCIQILKSVDNIGLTGPNNNAHILTQSFVSRKHMKLFEYYFPEEIINWFCDDWINRVYQKMNRFYPLKNHTCINVGGTPRYSINNNKYDHQQANALCDIIVQRDIEKNQR